MIFLRLLQGFRLSSVQQPPSTRFQRSVERISNNERLLKIQSLLPHLDHKQEIQQLIIDNAYAGPRPPHPYITSVLKKIERIKDKQPLVYQLIRFSLTARILESTHMQDTELFGQIHRYLGSIILKDTLVDRFDEFYDQLGQIPEYRDQLILKNRLATQTMMTYIQTFSRLCLNNQPPLEDNQKEEILKLFELVHETSLYLRYEWKVSFAYLKMFVQYCQKTNTPIDDLKRFQSTTAHCMDLMINDLHKLNNNQLILLMYLVSRLKISQINIRIHILFWHKFLQIVSPKMDEFNDYELRSIFKSINKSGFLTSQMEQFIKDRVHNIIIDNNSDPGYLYSLLAIVTNLGLKETDKFIQLFFQQVVKEQKKYEAVFFLYLNRIGVYDKDYWRHFIEIWPQLLIQEGNQGSLQQLSEDMMIALEFYDESTKEDLKRFLNDDKIRYLTENRVKQQEGYIDDHLLEGNLSKILLARGVNFRRDFIVGNTLVDFYLPEKNMIIEAMGSLHFVFRDYDPTLRLKKYSFHQDTEVLNFSIEYNQRTKNRLEFLQRKGFQVRTIDFYETQESSYNEILDRIL